MIVNLFQLEREGRFKLPLEVAEKIIERANDSKAVLLVYAAEGQDVNLSQCVGVVSKLHIADGSIMGSYRKLNTPMAALLPETYGFSLALLGSLVENVIQDDCFISHVKVVQG